jgi:hypothetical protein
MTILLATSRLPESTNALNTYNTNLSGVLYFTCISFNDNVSSLVYESLMLGRLINYEFERMWKEADVAYIKAPSTNSYLNHSKKSKAIPVTGR